MSELRNKVLKYLCSDPRTGADTSDLDCPSSRYGRTTREVAEIVATALEAIEPSIELDDESWPRWADQLMDGAVNDTEDVAELITQFGDETARDQLAALS